MYLLLRLSLYLVPLLLVAYMYMSTGIPFIDGVKSQVMDAVTGSVGWSWWIGWWDLTPELPVGGGALVPEVGSGIPSGSFGGASGSFLQLLPF